MNGRIATPLLRCGVFGALCLALVACPPIGRINPFDPASVPDKVSLPYFSLEDGTYATVQQVTIGCNTEGVTIYYTVDGSEPSAESTAFTGAIPVALSATLKAVASKAGLEDSDNASLALVLQIVPAAPTGLTATPADGAVTLAWQAALFADHYDLYYAAGTAAATSDTRVGPLAETTATVTGLQNGTQYAFVVTAAGSGGESAASNVVTCAPALPDTTPPADVTGLAVGDGNGQLTLTWADPTATDFDHVEITWTPGGTTPVSVSKAIQIYTAATLSNDTAYAFTVKSADSAGNKSAGAQAAGTPYGAVFVATTGSSGNSGLKPGAPKSAIADGMAAAQASGRSEVRVAGGTYAIASTITVANGVSLLGGYSASFGARDASANTTAITDTRTTWSSPNPAVLVSGTTTPLTVDGFTITAASGGGANMTYALQCVSSSEVTIGHNVLNAGEASLGYWSVALRLENCSGTVLQGNLIAGVDSPTVTYSFPIWGTDNTGGSIVGNRVVAGPGTTQSVAILIDGWASLLIANNVILANASPTSMGVFVREGTSITNNSGVIYNNTIDGGSGPGTAEAIRLRYSQLDIRNNIIVSTGGAIARCIRQEADTATCAAIRSNCFYSIWGLWRIDPATDILDLTTAETTLEGTQTLEYWGNVQVDPSFVNRPSGDLHLQASSPLKVRGGGASLSSTITTDLEGVGRTTSTPTGMTNAGATGWSIGAYEKD